MSADRATRVLFDAPGPHGRRRIALWSVALSLLLVGGLALALWQFQLHGQLEVNKWYGFLHPAIVRFLGDGILGTFQATLMAAVVAFPLGLLLALGRVSGRDWLRRPCTWWIEFFRSIPLLLVVYAFLLAFPRFGLNLPVFWKLVVPMILVSSASSAEVFRAGINAVDRGQYEAAASIGMMPGLGMRLVILPQAFRLVLPGLLTQLVSLLKDSTLGYVVSYPELMQQGRTLTSYTSYLIQTYLVIAVIYVVLNVLLTRLAHWLQGRTGRRAAAGHTGAEDLAAERASGLVPAAQ
jgi:glutamate transport system permease protein